MAEIRIDNLLAGFFFRKDHRFPDVSSELLNEVNRLYPPDFDLEHSPLGNSLLNSLLIVQHTTSTPTIYYKLQDEHFSFRREYCDDFESFQESTFALVDIYERNLEELSIYRSGLVIYFSVDDLENALSSIETKFLKNLSMFGSKKELNLHLNHDLEFKNQIYNTHIKLRAKGAETLTGEFDINQTNLEGLSRDDMIRIQNDTIEYFREQFRSYLLEEG